MNDAGAGDGTLAQADMLRLEDWLSGVPSEKPPTRVETEGILR